MEIVRVDDAAAFLDLAGPFVRMAEGRNQLVLGIAANAAAGRHGFSAFRGWVVVDGEPVAAAVRTAPRNAVLADPSRDGALEALFGALVRDAPDLPGVTGNVPAVDAFAEAWGMRTGVGASVLIHQGVWELQRVEEVRRPLGMAAPATREDVDLIIRWFVAFEAEALPNQDEPTVDDVRRGVLERLDDAEAGVWLWRVDDEAVSLVGFAGPTGTGIRIGPVYTPPEHRGRGHATALVADLSRDLLARGYARCFLYTDLSNPTANWIYARIGYRRIAESKMLAFDR
jgi:uncharacterized protein